jgi:hypothetical protein
MVDNCYNFRNCFGVPGFACIQYSSWLGVAKHNPKNSFTRAFRNNRLGTLSDARARVG